MKRLCTVLLYLIGCTSVVILGYSLLLHHIVGDQKSSGGSSAGHLPSATHPIERPRTANLEDQQRLVDSQHSSNVLVDRYNDHEFKLRSVKEKIDRLTFIGHNEDEAERAAAASHHQPKQLTTNVTTQHVHIFYRAPVAWYKTSDQVRKQIFRDLAQCIITNIRKNSSLWDQESWTMCTSPNVSVKFHRTPHRQVFFRLMNLNEHVYMGSDL